MIIYGKANLGKTPYHNLYLRLHNITAARLQVAPENHLVFWEKVANMPWGAALWGGT